MARTALAAVCVAVGSMLCMSAPAWGANGGKIAFGSGDPIHIWTVKPNGKGLRDLNSGAPADKRYCAPALSPDGTRIAYVDYATRPPLSDPNSSWSSLMVANSDGSGAYAIQTAWVFGSLCLHTLSWSPDGRSIAYTGSAPTATAAGIMAVQADTPLALPRTIVGDTQHSYFSALWSPDGDRIAADGDDGHEHIFSADGQSAAVTSSRDTCTLAAWAPDGAGLLEQCAASAGESAGIWRVRASDLGDHVPVYLGSTYDAAYSPDGAQIALRMNFGYPIYLGTMPADGSAAPTALLERDAYGISWSR